MIIPAGCRGKVGESLSMLWRMGVCVWWTLLLPSQAHAYLAPLEGKAGGRKCDSLTAVSWGEVQVMAEQHLPDEADSWSKSLTELDLKTVRLYPWENCSQWKPQWQEDSQ